MLYWGENIFTNQHSGMTVDINSSANGVRVVNFATSKNLFVKNKILQH